jgi:hypothetical protein
LKYALKTLQALPVVYALMMANCLYPDGIVYSTSYSVVAYGVLAGIEIDFENPLSITRSVKSDFKADTCPAFHIPLLRYAEYMFPLASIANKAPSVESPVFIKANLEYAGIEKELPIEIGVFPITPKQLPLDGKSVNEL